MKWWILYPPFHIAKLLYGDDSGGNHNDEYKDQEKENVYDACCSTT